MWKNLGRRHKMNPATAEMTLAALHTAEMNTPPERAQLKHHHPAVILHHWVLPKSNLSIRNLWFLSQSSFIGIPALKGRANPRKPAGCPRAISDVSHTMEPQTSIPYYQHQSHSFYSYCCFYDLCRTCKIFKWGERLTEGRQKLQRAA